MTIGAKAVCKEVNLLQEELNALIKEHDFAEYKKLLCLSQRLDNIIAKLNIISNESIL